MISVVVADDHPVFRSGLRTLVEESDALSFAGEAAEASRSSRGAGPRARTSC